jgi:low affinity Fe/Cu permease
MADHVLGMLASGLGALASVLLAILLVQMRGQRADTKTIAAKLDEHILDMTQVLALKMDAGGCKLIRQECIGLNHKIIKEPLQVQINEIGRKRRERWQAQAEENRKLWEAIHDHTHTAFSDPAKAERDKVIIKTP